MPEHTEKHPDTFFIIKLYLENKVIELGPYYDVANAYEIAVDFVPFYARALASDLDNFNYKVEVHESILSESSWTTLSITLTEFYK